MHLHGPSMAAYWRQYGICMCQNTGSKCRDFPGSPPPTISGGYWPIATVKVHHNGKVVWNSLDIGGRENRQMSHHLNKHSNITNDKLINCQKECLYYWRRGESTHSNVLQSTKNWNFYTSKTQKKLKEALNCKIGVKTINPDDGKRIQIVRYYEKKPAHMSNKI